MRTDAETKAINWSGCMSGRLSLKLVMKVHMFVSLLRVSRTASLTMRSLAFDRSRGNPWIAIVKSVVSGVIVVTKRVTEGVGQQVQDLSVLMRSRCPLTK